MAGRKARDPLPEGQDSLFPAAEIAAAAGYADQPLDPECTIRTIFSELKVGDMVDYWGTPVYMVTMCVSQNGRTYIQCKDGRKCQFALAPDDEIVWRQPRME